MRALVVYESLWGNSEMIARAIASELELTMTVELVDSDSAPAALKGYDLVVVGGPTHAFSMTRPGTRADAVKQHSAPRAPGLGIREWLGQLIPTTSPRPAITFDTRVDAPRLPGSAANAARHELRSLGFDVRVKPKSFRVHGYTGPLVDGEITRATQWVRDILTTLSVTPQQ